MRFTKPAWVMHQDGTRSENAKRLSIFSVHVHPDGSRIATGGLDAKVRIWSTRPILHQPAETANKPPKSLCTLAMHTGPVLTVRWAHSGRWLASGSDDEIVMIWDLDPSKAGKVWGSDEVNVEGWKPLKRLPGHESDVTDIAWSPEDRYLASTGLDSKVLIWCGYTLERLRKLDLHQGFVKGVCWDPVGEFLATQSDDRTVRIWRTLDWALEATIDKPFEHSPGSTFFRRLSWSPDGAHITASNATNNNGFVFTAAVITRNTWTSDISLVGHENTVEVAAYNPHIFLRDPSMPVVTSNICSVVALGADDQSISVWQTKSARPLIVAKAVFERQIMDLSWSWDGLALYAVSSDGTLAVFAFDPAELEGIAPLAAQKTYLQKFGFVPPPLPAGFAHPQANEAGHGHATPPPSPPPQNKPSLAPTLAAPHVSQTGFDGASRGGERVTTLVARRAPKDRTKRRVQPTFVGAMGSAGVPSASSSTTVGTGTGAGTTTFGFGDGGIKLPPPPMQGLGGFGDIEMDVDGDGAAGHGFAGKQEDMEVPISALDTGRRRGKGEVAVAFSDDGRAAPRARTLGGDRVREAGGAARGVREIRAGAPSVFSAGAGLGLGLSGMGGAAGALPVPGVNTFLEVRAEETGDILEARNSEDCNTPTEVSFFMAKDKTVQWLDYLPAPALSLCVSTRFCAVAMEDGALNVYSLTGRRIMPTLSLGSPISFLDAAKHHLMAITSGGQVNVWNTKTSIALHPPTSLLHLLTPSPPSPSHPNGISPTILTAIVRPNGAPLVHLSTGTALTFDAALMSWVRVGETWWTAGSDVWKGRPRAGSSSSNTNSMNNAVVAGIEARISERLDPASPLTEAEKARPTWWRVALTLGHLETRMHAARALGSSNEYRAALLLYAGRLADEGFRGKAEEVLKELYGPVYWRPGKLDESWSPTVLGLVKRDLAREVLNIFAKSKTLFKLAQDYQELLKKSGLDD